MYKILVGKENSSQDFSSDYSWATETPLPAHCFAASCRPVGLAFDCPSFSPSNGRAVHYNGSSLLQWKSVRLDVTLSPGECSESCFSLSVHLLFPGLGLHRLKLNKHSNWKWAICLCCPLVYTKPVILWGHYHLEPSFGNLGVTFAFVAPSSEKSEILLLSAVWSFTSLLLMGR